MSDINLEVRVYPIEEPKGTTLAFASVSIDDLIAIRGIRVVDGDKGLFVSMPQSQDRDGEYHDIAFPLNADLRNEMNDAILDEYDYVMETEQQNQGRGNRDNRDNRDNRNDRNDRNKNGRNGNDRNNRQQGSGQKRSMGDRMRSGKEKANNHNNSQQRQQQSRSRDSGSR